MLPLALPLNDDTVTPGFLGFGVFLALLVALVFLVRSMNKQMKKIQAPKEADLRQQEWERAQAAKAGRDGTAPGTGPAAAAKTTGAKTETAAGSEKPAGDG
ncbi:hypothetical protein [Actinomadura fibrosa]|uniref:Uncharacterized protein n=1 Tax=Actinomadura fibrosa TaxID=111802 RepID=A0ABW2XKX1_9ACTN|nr:hypothetical protein [Actinomadura fibrosa]